MFNDKFLRVSVCAILAINFFIIGCGGHQPNCVDRYMPGDENRSCASLYAEVQSVENEIEQTQASRKSRDTWNVIEFIGGILFIVPFFFMDTKGSHEAEVAALEARQKQLKIFFADKGCSVADLQESNVKVANANLGNMQAQKSQTLPTNCSECKSLLRKESGINIYQSEWLCTNCFKNALASDTKVINAHMSDSDRLRTQCPHCKSTFKVKQEYIGRKTRCKKCEQIFTIEEWAPQLVSEF